MPEERISVLIVDDIPETRENVRKLLQFEPSVEVVGVAGNGKEAISLAERLKPDVVVMDINMPDMDGITATEKIRERLPYAQIVILSVQGEVEYMRRAMLAGARDFLTKPPNIDELVRAVRRAGALAHEERAKLASQVPSASASHGGASATAATGKVITLFSPKGGLGTTTLAVNLAVALHTPDTPAAIVDGDMEFGDVAIVMNEHGRHTIVDLAPRAAELEPEVVSSVMVQHEGTGVSILAAPTRPDDASKVNGEQFGQILRFLRGMYEYVVVDTPSSLNDVAVAALDASDLVVLVISQEIPSIKDGRLFLDWMRRADAPFERILIAMNKFDKRIGITPQRVGDTYHHPVEIVIPSDVRAVLPAINKGVPVLKASRGAQVSRAILKMAEVVRRRLTELESVAAM